MSLLSKILENLITDVAMVIVFVIVIVVIGINCYYFWAKRRDTANKMSTKWAQYLLYANLATTVIVSFGISYFILHTIMHVIDKDPSNYIPFFKPPSTKPITNAVLQILNTSK